jgi:hypothetical protein
MKTITGLLPLAIAIAVIGSVTWFLLSRDIGLGRWLLAGLLFAHGWVHVLFVFPSPASASTSAPASRPEWPFDMGRSWVIRGMGLDAATVRTLGVVLVAAVFAGFLLTAMSTVGILVPAGWWSGLVVGAAVGSTVLLSLFFSPMLLLGFAVNVALVGLVVASTWRPGGVLP